MIEYMTTTPFFLYVAMGIATIMFAMMIPTAYRLIKRNH